MSRFILRPLNTNAEGFPAVRAVSLDEPQSDEIFIDENGEAFVYQIVDGSHVYRKIGSATTDTANFVDTTLYTSTENVTPFSIRVNKTSGVVLTTGYDAVPFEINESVGSISEGPSLISVTPNEFMPTSEHFLTANIVKHASGDYVFAIGLDEKLYSYSYNRADSALAYINRLDLPAGSSVGSEIMGVEGTDYLLVSSIKGLIHLYNCDLTYISTLDVSTTLFGGPYSSESVNILNNRQMLFSGIYPGVSILYGVEERGTDNVIEFQLQLNGSTLILANTYYHGLSHIPMKLNGNGKGDWCFVTDTHLISGHGEAVTETLLGANWGSKTQLVIAADTTTGTMPNLKAFTILNSSLRAHGYIPQSSETYDENNDFSSTTPSDNFLNTNIDAINIGKFFFSYSTTDTKLTVYKLDASFYDLELLKSNFIIADELNVQKISAGNATQLNVSVGLGSLSSNTTGIRCVGVGVNSLLKNTSGTDNIGVGANALLSNTTGSGNVGMGTGALHSNTEGDNNIGVGTNSLYNNTVGTDNVGIGINALYSNTEGGLNTGMGTNSLYSNTVGTGNVGMGTNSLRNNIGGHNNAGIGINALYSNTEGYNNIGVGANSLYSNTTGTDNTGSGANSLFKNTTGSYNTGLGSSSLYNNTEGTDNTGVGASSLFSNLDGSFNVALGSNSLYANTVGLQNVGVGVSSLRNNIGGSDNVAAGFNSLYSNTVGANNVGVGSRSLRNNIGGSDNVALGSNSLLSNTVGYGNTALGTETLRSNEGGIFNVASGYQALYSNVSGNNNIASGYRALYSNGDGTDNIANGYEALYSNASGNYNIANGYEALYSNASGNNNIANGHQALYSNTTGSGNVANGSYSMHANETGSNNTAVGHLALLSGTTTNCTAIGYNAQATGPDQVQLGDLITTVYYTSIAPRASDRRDKIDIRDTSFGLDFIKKLRPTEYRMDYRDAYIEKKEILETVTTEEVIIHEDGSEETILVERDEVVSVEMVEHESDGSKAGVRFHQGLIAQEVKEVLDEMGADWAGYIDFSHNGGKEDRLTIAYMELVTPMVRAIQELSDKNDYLEGKLNELLERQ